MFYCKRIEKRADHDHVKGMKLAKMKPRKPNIEEFESSDSETEEDDDVQLDPVSSASETKEEDEVQLDPEVVLHERTTDTEEIIETDWSLV